MQYQLRFLFSIYRCFLRQNFLVNFYFIPLYIINPDKRRYHSNIVYHPSMNYLHLQSILYVLQYQQNYSHYTLFNYLLNIIQYHHFLYFDEHVNLQHIKLMEFHHIIEEYLFVIHYQIICHSQLCHLFD